MIIMIMIVSLIISLLAVPLPQDSGDDGRARPASQRVGVPLRVRHLAGGEAQHRPRYACVCVCVCVCVHYIYIYIYIYTCIYVYIYTYMHLCVCVFVCLLACLYIIC